MANSHFSGSSFSRAIRDGAIALRSLFSNRRGWLAFGLGMLSLLWVLSLPARAADVQIRPANPQLGDTISVMIQADPGQATPPVVTFDQKQYPVFPLGGDRFRALLPTTPLDRPGRKEIQVTGAGDPRTFAVSVRDRSFPVQRITVRGGGSDGTDYEFSRVDQFKQLVTPQKFWNGAFARPAAGGVTSEYGVRRYYNGVFADDYYHKGVDYGGGTGAPVVAPAAGRVVLVGREADGFVLHGNTIGVDHGQGVASIFIHLSRIDVQEGDFVQPGQRIGAIGATGSATGPNLHWGLYVSGQAIDPVPWRQQGFE